jgi:hypothetical protein
MSAQTDKQVSSDLFIKYQYIHHPIFFICYNRLDNTFNIGISGDIEKAKKSHTKIPDNHFIYVHSQYNDKIRDKFMEILKDYMYANNKYHYKCSFNLAYFSLIKSFITIHNENDNLNLKAKKFDETYDKLLNGKEIDYNIDIRMFTDHNDDDYCLNTSIDDYFKTNVITCKKGNQTICDVCSC